MRRTIIAAEHFTFSSNPPRFAGRARLARKRGRALTPTKAGRLHHCLKLARMLPRGWICARRSGKALMSVQRSPSPEMAKLASVRVRTRFPPAPAIRHTLQSQFLRNAAARRRTE
jgi:hypothetical protein